jgi:hypothetical protein
MGGRASPDIPRRHAAGSCRPVAGLFTAVRLAACHLPGRAAVIVMMEQLARPHAGTGVWAVHGVHALRDRWHGRPAELAGAAEAGEPDQRAMAMSSEGHRLTSPTRMK